MKLAIGSLACVAAFCAACTATSERGDETSAGGAALNGPSPDGTVVCELEYETFSPAFAVAPAASLTTTLAELRTRGATASDGKYELAIFMNAASTDLPFQAVIQSVAHATAGDDVDIAYDVLPEPTSRTGFFMEVGGSIQPETLPTDKGSQVFDHLRAYCSFR